MPYDDLGRKVNPAFQVMNGYVGRPVRVLIRVPDNGKTAPFWMEGKLIFFDFINKNLVLMTEREVIYIKHYILISRQKETGEYE